MTIVIWYDFSRKQNQQLHRKCLFWLQHLIAQWISVFIFIFCPQPFKWWYKHQILHTCSFWVISEEEKKNVWQRNVQDGHHFSRWLPMKPLNRMHLHKNLTELPNLNDLGVDVHVFKCALTDFATSAPLKWIISLFLVRLMKLFVILVTSALYILHNSLSVVWGVVVVVEVVLFLQQSVTPLRWTTCSHPHYLHKLSLLALWRLLLPQFYDYLDGIGPDLRAEFSSVTPNLEPEVIARLVEKLL